MLSSSAVRMFVNASARPAGLEGLCLEASARALCQSAALALEGVQKPTSVRFWLLRLAEPRRALMKHLRISRAQICQCVNLSPRFGGG